MASEAFILVTIIPCPLKELTQGKAIELIKASQLGDSSLKWEQIRHFSSSGVSNPSVTVVIYMHAGL